MNLENLMLSERSQAQMSTEYTIPFIWDAQDRQIPRDCRSVIARVWQGQGDGEELLTGERVSFSRDENVVELDSGDGCTTWWYTKNHWVMYLQKVNLMGYELFQ